MTPYDAVVLITGASSGIGAAAAEAFDRAGARLALAARRRERLDSVAERMRDALVIPTDVSRTEEARSMVDRTIAHFGRIDVLINNAATIHMTRSDSLTAADIQRSMDTNFIGPMAATQRAVGAMRRQGRGHIINIGSPGYLVGIPMMAPYTASKAALSSWTRTMQAEWADVDIDVTEFFPGHVDTDSRPESDLGDFGADIFEDPRLSAASRWLVRTQSPEEIAKQLVGCVRNPRASVYSHPSVRVAAFLGLFARLRVDLGASMARTVRARIGTPMFTPMEPSVAGSSDGKKASFAAPEVPTLPKGEETLAVAPLPSEPVKGQTTKKKRTAKRVAKKKAAKPTTAKKTGAKKATRKKVAAKKEVAPKKKVAAKKVGGAKGLGKKASILSPEATERVRAAAERAAASAKSGAPLQRVRKPRRGDGESSGS